MFPHVKSKALGVLLLDRVIVLGILLCEIG